ncbi:MAG: DMT family transporter [Arenicellales bacterium]
MQAQTKDNTLKGIVILVIATFFFAAQDALTKRLTQTLSVFEIVCIRFFIFSLFALVFAHKRIGIWQGLKSANPGLQIIRGLLISSEIAVFAYAIRFLGLAEMHALFACFPLLITVLSVPMLGERVGWRRWLAVIVGFLGTLLIIRPGIGVFDPFSTIALIAALMFAVYNILTRKVSRTDRFETSLLYFGLAGFLAFLLAMPFVWQTPTTEESALLISLSITSIIGHLCLIKSLELVPAVILQPFNYFVLVWAIVFGYLLYGEVLEPVTLFGAGMVVASGVFIAQREHRLKGSRRDWSKKPV